AFRENLLFTHRGVSGPAVLQASSYWREGQAVTVDLLPDDNVEEVLEAATERGWGLQRLLESRHPRRFAQGWCQRYGYSGVLSGYSKREMEALSRHLQAWEICP